MRTTMLPALLFAALWMPAAGAADGLRLPQTQAPDVSGWQARFGLTTLRPTSAAEFPAEIGAMPSAQVFGDYYFTGPGFGQGSVAGGLRATSGLLLGARGAGLAPPLAGSGLTVAHRRTDPGGAGVPLPYVGVGYTGQSLRGGWAFSADLGLIGAPRTPGLRWQASGVGLEEAVRDLRLTPTVQLGASYSF